MPAYIVFETPVLDPEQRERYKPAADAAADAVAAGGGRFIAAGGEVAVLQGDWQPKRLMLLEFPDLGGDEAVLRVTRVSGSAAAA